MRWIKRRIPRWARTLKRVIIYHLFYRGDARYCPVCRHHSSAFLPMNWRELGLHRDDARCPYCHSFERHRLLYLFLQRKSDFFTNPAPRDVLHVAPEPCLRALFRKQPGLRYITADLGDPSVDVKIDVCNSHFPDNSFDVILCSHVLEHVPDDQKAMREFARTLKPGGWAILLVPVDAPQTFEDPGITDRKERDRVFGPDHVRKYGPDYADRLRKNHFDVSCTYPRDFLSAAEIARMGITPAAGEIYFCRKSNRVS